MKFFLLEMNLGLEKCISQNDLSTLRNILDRGCDPNQFIVNFEYIFVESAHPNFFVRME